MGRHIEERQDGLGPVDAIHMAARRTGRAFFTSALTIIGGFAVLILSSLPLLRDFGIIVTLNVTIALLSALVLMPPMLVWADQLGMLHLKDQEDIPGAVKLAATFPGPATPTAVVGALAFAGGAVASYVSADTDKGETTEVSYAPVPSTTTTTHDDHDHDDHDDDARARRHGAARPRRPPRPPARSSTRRRSRPSGPRRRWPACCSTV